jgi:peroxiredoxin
MRPLISFSSFTVLCYGPVICVSIPGERVLAEWAQNCRFQTVKILPDERDSGSYPRLLCFNKEEK